MRLFPEYISTGEGLSHLKAMQNELTADGGNEYLDYIWKRRKAIVPSTSSKTDIPPPRRKRRGFPLQLILDGHGLFKPKESKTEKCSPENNGSGKRNRNAA